jgi:hypothetical protein
MEPELRLWIASERIVRGEAYTIRCGSVHRHKASRMIGSETKRLSSQRVAGNVVIDHSFAASQLPKRR